MAQDLYSLKMNVQKIEELIPILEKLDYLIELLSIYDTDEARELLELFKMYYKEIKEIIANKDNIIILGEDLRKGTWNGKRKLDIDLSLNKKGIKETTTLEDALVIWQDQPTTVYYSGCNISFTDGTSIGFMFTNDDNQEIDISTHAELAFQIQKNTAVTEKMVNTSLMVDTGGRVGVLVRIVDVGGNSNILRVQLVVKQICKDNYVSKTPSYTWVDTTSILTILMNALPLLQRLPDNLQDMLDIIIDNSEYIRIVAQYLEGLCYGIPRAGRITQPIVGSTGTECRDRDVFRIIAENIETIIAVANGQNSYLLASNNLSDVQDTQQALINLQLGTIIVDNQNEPEITPEEPDTEETGEEEEETEEETE